MGMDLLDLEFVQALSSELRDGVRIIKAEVLVQPVECPFCKAADPYRHDTREQEFADAPVRGVPVRIKFDRRRYRCRACRKTFFEPILGFSSKRNMTQRLVHYVARDSLIRTFADVSRDVSLDVQTIRGVFFDFSDWLRANHPIDTPSKMGIDEASRAKKLCTVITDLERRDYVEMLPTRDLKPVKAYLRDIKNKERITVVAMDLYTGFIAAIGTHIPNAVRVADRFHVVRYGQKAVANAQLHARKTLSPGGRLAMFRKRSILSTARKRLTPEDAVKVDEVMAQFPLLAQVNDARERFLTIYESDSRRAAGFGLDAWLGTLTPEVAEYFKELVSIVTRNREVILNYFDHKYTNAFTEAANGISKLMEKMGRGYGFEVMRVKLLYGKRGQVVDLSAYDVDRNDSSGGFTTELVYSAPRPSPPRTRKPSASTGRRGPNVREVEALVEAGYYDLGNSEIANELEPLIASFARQY